MRVVSCDTLSIGFEAPGYGKTCQAGTVGSGPQTIALESVEATNGNKRFNFAKMRSGPRIVFYRQTPRSLAADPSLFHATRNWSPGPSISGFDVQIFEGRPLATSGFQSCAGFADNSGRHFKGAGGVTTILFGFYCEDDGDGIEPEDLRAVMNGLRF